MDIDVPEPTEDTDLDDTKKYLAALSAANQPLTIRKLIGFWGYKGRGKRIVSVIEQDLSEMGFRTEPPFDSGFLDSSVLIEHVPGDARTDLPVERQDAHLLTLARIPSATYARRPEDDMSYGFATRDTAVETALTVMLQHDFSQVPVVESGEERAVIGAFSWESYGSASLRGLTPRVVTDAMVPVAPVDLHSDLFANVGPIIDRGFVVVTLRGRLSGIVTAADLTREFEQLTVPFLAVGRCEQELRRVARVLLSPPAGRSIDDMMFGQLQDLYKSQWDRLGWSLSKDLFVAWLNDTRRLRNSIAHFDNQDDDRGDEVRAVHRLTEWLRSVSPGRGEEEVDATGGKH